MGLSRLGLFAAAAVHGTNHMYSNGRILLLFVETNKKEEEKK